MKMQPVHKEDWDYLIILDACRFDYFERLYSDYLDGELEKVRSRASSTQPWLWKTFPGEYDYSYLSTNPFINSKDYSLDYFSSRYTDWSAVDHFNKVFDVWDEKWNEEKDTVLPEDVVKSAEDKEDWTPMIIHLVQPHSPYLSYDKKTTEFYSRRLIKNIEDKSVSWGLAASVFHLLPPQLQSVGKKMLGIKRKKTEEKVAEDVGKEQFQELYRDNVCFALEAVKKLSERLNGKIVVSADHGEFVGEDNRYGHELFNADPLLREVPWFELESSAFHTTQTESLREVKK